MILSKNRMFFYPLNPWRFFFKFHPTQLRLPYNILNLETKRQNGKKDNMIYGKYLAFPAIVWSFVNIASTASTEASERAFRQPNTVRNFQEIFLIIDLIRKDEMTFDIII